MCGCEHHWDVNAPCTCDCPEHSPTAATFTPVQIGNAYGPGGNATACDICGSVVPGPLHGGGESELQRLHREFHEALRQAVQP